MRFITLLSILLILTSLVGAQTQRGYRSWFDETLLSGRAEIAIVRVEKASRLPSGERVHRLKVSRRLHGRGDAHILAVGGARRLPPDLSREYLVFLDRASQRTLRTMVDVVDLPPEGEGRARVVLVDALLKSRAERLERLRIRSVEKVILTHLESESSWVRRIIVRELDRLSRYRPGVFDALEWKSLAKLKSGDLSTRERTLLRRARERIANKTGVGWTLKSLGLETAAKEKAFLAELARFQNGSDAAWRSLFLDRCVGAFEVKVVPLLSSSTSDEQAAVRRRAIYWLEELEASFGAGALLDVVRSPKWPVVDKKAALKALEGIAPLDAAETLMKISETKALRVAAWRVLAAINSGDAKIFLKDRLILLESNPKSPPEEVEALRFLESAEFRAGLEKERQRRRATRTARDKKRRGETPN